MWRGTCGTVSIAKTSTESHGVLFPFSSYFATSPHCLCLNHLHYSPCHCHASRLGTTPSKSSRRYLSILDTHRHREHWAGCHRPCRTMHPHTRSLALRNMRICRMCGRLSTSTPQRQQPPSRARCNAVCCAGFVCCFSAMFFVRS